MGHFWPAPPARAHQPTINDLLPCLKKTTAVPATAEVKAAKAATIRTETATVIATGAETAKDKAVEKTASVTKTAKEVKEVKDVKAEEAHAAASPNPCL